MVRNVSTTFQEPTYEAVLSHFVMLGPKNIGCSREQFARGLNLIKAVRKIPKSPEDLKVIFAAAKDEALPGKRECWIALYRSYREEFARLNGRYPANDVPDDFSTNTVIVAKLAEPSRYPSTIGKKFEYPIVTSATMDSESIQRSNESPGKLLELEYYPSLEYSRPSNDSPIIEEVDEYPPVRQRSESKNDQGILYLKPSPSASPTYDDMFASQEK